MGRLKQKKRLVEMRKIGFNAPNQIHGALKMIVGYCEMMELEYNGKPLTERDFLASLIAGFYRSDQNQWIDMINRNLACLESTAGLPSEKIPDLP